MTRREDTEARRSRPALSRERIVTLALRVLDREGLGALSMRRLADELGVGTMTVSANSGWASSPPHTLPVAAPASMDTDLRVPVQRSGIIAMRSPRPS